MISKLLVVRRAQMQDTRHTFEMKKPATSNSLVYIQIAISTPYGKPQSKEQIHTQKKRSQNTILNLDIRSQGRRSQERRRGREEKRLKKQIQNNVLNVSKNIHVDNYLKGKWVKCFNQKTQTG